MRGLPGRLCPSLARELCLAALGTLVQRGRLRGSSRYVSGCVHCSRHYEETTGATVPRQERLTHLLTRTAEDVAFEVATNLILQSPALADLEYLLGLPQTAPPRLHRQGVLPWLVKRTWTC